jgi:cell wall assembly regulator SMI1
LKTQSIWHKFLENITADVTLHAPVLPEEVEKAESSLDVSFPDELKSLLQESNGIEGSYDLGLIWNIERITKDNLFFRQFLDYKDL